MESFSELSGKKRAIELLRWICVPVAAVLAVVAVRIVAGIAMPPIYAQPPGTPIALPSDFHRFVLPRIFGVLMAAAFVLAGAIVAPRYRLVPATALAVLWTVYSFMNYVLVHLGQGTPHYLDFVLAAAAAGGAAYIFYSERSKGRRQ